MDTKIKALLEATENTHLQKLFHHVKQLVLQEGHLILYVTNSGPLHELESKEMEAPLRHALEKVYDPSITYELKLHHPNSTHEREKVTGKRNPW